MNNDKWLSQFTKTAAVLAALTIGTSSVTSAAAGEMILDPIPGEEKDAPKAEDGKTEKGKYGEKDKSGRPDFDKYLRQNEDWSQFDPDASGRDGIMGFFDRLKHIDLNNDGTIWLSVGGSVRARYEHYENYKFDPAGDDGFLLTRVLLHGDLHLGENVRVFVQGKSAFSTERDLSGGQRTKDSDELALQQAFADLLVEVGDNGTLTLRGGRQMLSFGNQRLISPMHWNNSMQAWDGVSAIFDHHSGWSSHAFWTQKAKVKKYEFNNSDAQTQLFGVYTTGPISEDNGINADVYFLGLDKDDNVTFNGTTGDERRYTVGGRLFGNVPNCGLDYDVEAAYQFGDLGAAEISAWMFATEVGFTFKGKHKVRPFIGFDYASGDNGAGGDVGTFNQLYPVGHDHLGYVDTVGRQNIIAASAGVSFKPVKKLKARIAAHAFWRADTSDALYSPTGSVILAGNLSGSRYVGSEVDLTLKYKVCDNTTIMFGFSHFVTGAFIDNAAPTKNDNLSTAKVQVEFIY